MFEPGVDNFSTNAIGVVVDVNDPQQMGRIRARVPSYGDTIYDSVDQIPWCTYVSSFGGMVQTNTFTRGPQTKGTEDSQSIGPVAYGMFNIPKPGALVVVSCIDGDPMLRIWLGCIFVEQTTHTMPHGRYFYDPQILDKKGFGNLGQPEGPLSSSEDKIQPLYDNQLSAFGSKRNNYEWRTRGADFSATGLTDQWMKYNNFVSEKSDDEDFVFNEKDGNKKVSRSGYKVSRLEPDLPFESTGKNYEPQVYCWTTPGFHAISMDDSIDNCRMRFRTTTGHQIILDDANERIYISTNLGDSWVEMDSDGSIDIFAGQKLSIHAANDINITSDQSIRMFAQRGIHMYTKADIRMQALQNMHIKLDGAQITHAKEAIHVKTDKSYYLQAKTDINMSTEEGDFAVRAQKDITLKSNAKFQLSSGADIDIKSNGPFKLTSQGDLSVTGNASILVKSSGALKLTSGAGLDLLSSGNVCMQGSTLNFTGATILYSAGFIHMPLLTVTVDVNRGGGAAAIGASVANPIVANPTQILYGPALPEKTYWTNRIPNHEPWGRVSTEHDFTHAPRVPYDDPGVGKDHRQRGPHWHR